MTTSYKKVIEKFIFGSNTTDNTQKRRELNYIASLTQNKGLILKSYNTIISAKKNNIFFISNRKYSTTTSKQVNELKKQLKKYGFNYKMVFDVPFYVDYDKLEEVM